MDVVKGKVVITSKETEAYEKAITELETDYTKGSIQIYEVAELATAVIWMFRRECDAALFAERAMNMGFEYVHREV